MTCSKIPRKVTPPSPHLSFPPTDHQVVITRGSVHVNPDLPYHSLDSKSCFPLSNLTDQRYTPYRIFVPTSVLTKRPQCPQPQIADHSSLRQQTRDLSFGPSVPVPPEYGGKRDNTRPLQRLQKPGSQIEAMPPSASPVIPLHPIILSYNSATRHPVFFTPDLRKAPFPLPIFPAAGFHPVATGYVLEQRKVLSDGSATKL